MAGHSKFKNIQHRKGAQDKKRAKVFTKLIREIVVAAKEGLPDPEHNPRLRAAISAARSGNMPLDNITRAIKKAAGGDDDTNYEEMRYEGYGPGGVAVIVEVLTDNRNRTASTIRTAFNKSGGSLGETNSVSFMFDRIGQIDYPLEAASGDDMFEAALEAGADDVETTDEGHEILCATDKLMAIRDELAGKLGDPSSAKLVWRPKTSTELTTEEAAEKILKFIDVLEDEDDVQNVFANFEIPDAILEKMAE